MNMKEYKLNIDPRILELLGPSLYTNIYYIIAELIANAYDADAHNVYIIDNGTNITVEDDGNGMSYVGGEIGKYLNVARISRNSESDAETKLGRKKMGRKGVGKLAALSVSENVLVKTITNDEKSGFVERFPELSLFYRLFSPLNSEMICIFPYFCPYAESAREIRGIFVALHINNWFSEPILI